MWALHSTGRLLEGHIASRFCVAIKLSLKGLYCAVCSAYSLSKLSYLFVLLAELVHKLLYQPCELGWRCFLLGTTLVDCRFEHLALPS